MHLKSELKKLFEIIKQLDRKVLIVFFSVGVLQTISWYYTSRRFFRNNLYFTVFKDNPDVALIEYLFWFVGDFLTFFVIPIFIIKFLLNERVTDFGIKLGDYRAGLKISLIFLAVMLPIVWLVSSTPEFASKYPHLPSARDNLNVFLIYEAGMLAYMFGWEFIWRGFTLFGLEEKFGYYAVLIQMVPFVILHNGKPPIETFGAILGGIALGILAFRTRSFIYCVLVHFGVMFSIDTISTLRYQSADYGLGFDSLLNILSQLF